MQKYRLGLNSTFKLSVLADLRGQLEHRSTKTTGQQEHSLAPTQPVSSLKPSFVTLLAVGKYKTKHQNKHMILGNNNLLWLKGELTKNNYLLKGGSMPFLMAATV